jgi:hypothetical protein
LEKIMTLKFPVFATALLLASGLALAEPVDTAAASSGVATAVGAGASGATAAKPGQPPVAKTRAEVRAEAVEEVRQYRSTFARDLDFLKN